MFILVNMWEIVLTVFLCFSVISWYTVKRFGKDSLRQVPFMTLKQQYQLTRGSF